MIRAANIKYLEEILKIEEDVFPRPWSRQQLINDLHSTINIENLVYINDKKVVAYLLGNKVIDEFHLHNIAVHKNFQRKHIGIELINHLINHLRYQGFKKIFLEVSEKNEPAKKLYQSVGFQKKGRRRDYYSKGDHAFLYHLNLETNG